MAPSLDTGMLLKDIVVFVDEQPRAEARLRFAAELARIQRAHLAGVHIMPFARLPPLFNAAYSQHVLDAHRDALRATAASAETQFRKIMQQEKVEAEWRKVPAGLTDGGATAMAALHARYADLAVIGQRTSADPVSSITALAPEDVVLLSGRPLLIVPYAGEFSGDVRNPLIAWKSTREAARAVNDALPLLELARKSTVMTVDPTDAGGQGQGADIACHLSRHGIDVTVEQTASGGIPTADVFLSRAADLGADLLVMGAYGHRRLRELLLGGMTRDILDRMTLPVLMAH